MSFNENIIQTSHVNVYFPGSGNCTGNTTCNENTPIATCNGCDWQFDKVTCNQGCPSQPACSQIDGNTCPQLGENIQFQWNNSNGMCPVEPVVKCTYDSSTFSYQDVLKYQNDFCEDSSCSDNSNFNNIIAPTFCMKSTTVCPIIPGTTQPWESCPNILSNINGSVSGNPGATCTEWSSDSSNSTIYNTTIANFCRDNPTDGTCQCVNRTNSQVFNYINNGMRQSGNFSPACWYTPCANPQAFLVPTSLNNANCTSAACARVNEIIRTTPTNLTKAQLQAELNCTITATPTPIPPTPISTQSSIISPSVVAVESTSWFWIIFIVILIIIFIIFFFIIFYAGSAGTATTTAVAVV